MAFDNTEIHALVERIKHADGAGNLIGTLLLAGPVTANEVRVQYKALALRIHPDKNHGDKGCAEAFLLVQRAYNQLCADLGDPRQVSRARACAPVPVPSNPVDRERLVRMMAQHRRCPYESFPIKDKLWSGLSPGVEHHAGRPAEHLPAGGGRGGHAPRRSPSLAPPHPRKRPQTAGRRPARTPPAKRRRPAVSAGPLDDIFQKIYT